MDFLEKFLVMSYSICDEKTVEVDFGFSYLYKYLVIIIT